MSTLSPNLATSEALYHGLRMTAVEYLQLPTDGFRYELIDGVICISPSPSSDHQRTATCISGEIYAYLREHPVGEVMAEVDVNLGVGPRGGDLVYRPDVVFIEAQRWIQMGERMTGVPDVVVEVISRTSRRYDRETKKTDYERSGVAEYWLIDPERGTMTFCRLQDGRYVDVTPEGDSFASESVPGLVLDLNRVRRTF